MVVFPAMTRWEIRERSIWLISSNSWMIRLMVETTTSCNFFSPPGLWE